MGAGVGMRVGVRAGVGVSESGGGMGWRYENRGGRDWCGSGGRVVVMLRQCWWYRNVYSLLRIYA